MLIPNTSCVARILMLVCAFSWAGLAAQSTISDCNLFADGPNATWTHVLTLTTLNDEDSDEQQSFSMHITSLPPEGANYRVYKTTANGTAFFGPVQALTIGDNGANISSVDFDRVVKIQFSSGDIGFDELIINDEEENSCFPSPDAGTAISGCPDQFSEGVNPSWPYVLTLTTANDAGSSNAQSFSMNITSLPAGGANYRVYKTTPNGSDFFGNAQALSIGANGTTVSAVTFDRVVKIQFSSGDVQFDDLTVNSNAVSCEAAPAPATAPSDNAADPTRDAADVVSVYGDTYTSIANNFNPFWGQSGSVNTAFDPGTGNPVLHYTNFNYQGTDLNALNLSGMTHLHVDVWVAEANANRMLKVSPINNGSGQGEWLVEVPFIPGSWNSVDLEKSDFQGMTWDNVFQMKFDGQFNADDSYNGDGWDVYLDNIYFWNDGTGETIDDNGGGATDVNYVNVTFNVNMANEDVSPDGVYLAGGADFGFPGDNPMSDDDGDGIWTITKEVIAPYTGNYTFLNGNCPYWSCKEDISGQECANGPYNDRLLDNITEDHVVNTCFGECTTDGTCPAPPSVFHDLTFIVHTDNIDVGPNGMYVGGGVLGAANAYALANSNEDENKWSTTISVADGTSGNYIFLNSPNGGGDWGAKEILQGLPCSDPGNYNDRILEPVTDDTTLEYCFGTCDEQCPAPGEMYDVTFRVDMNNFEGDDYSTVNLNGTFTNWCGGCVPMSDDDEDGVYEVTVNIEEGTVEYKFTLDGWSQQEMFQEGESCTTTIDGFTNRSLTFASDTALTAVCYNSCDACPVPGCTDSSACNYNPMANVDDGSCGAADDCGTCHVPYCYNPVTHIPAFGVSAADCTPPNLYISGTGGGMTNLDSPMSPSWNAACSGCLDANACNYDGSATIDDASCTYPPHADFDCDGNCNNDADGDGICDELEGLIPEAETACGIGTMWDADLGQCVFNVECAGDIDLDGAVTANDILLMLSNFGTWCPGHGPDAE